MFCDPGGSKSRLAKAAGAEPCGKIGNEKLHAVVARSRFISQNAKKASLSEHVRTLLDVEVWKKCTQLWRETHFDVTMLKTHKNTTCLGRFLTLRCRKSARRCGGEHTSQSKSAKHTTCEPLLDVEPTLQLQLQLPLPLQLQQHDTTLQLQLQLQLQLHYFTTTTTTTFTLHYNHTTLHQAVVHPVTTATTPQSTAPTTFRSISGFGLPSQQLTSPIGFLSLKLPPLPCSVLLMILMQIAGDKNGVCMFVREFLMVWILSTPPQVVPKWLTGYGAVA